MRGRLRFAKKADVIYIGSKRYSLSKNKFYLLTFAKDSSAADRILTWVYTSNALLNSKRHHPHCSPATVVQLEIAVEAGYCSSWAITYFIAYSVYTGRHYRLSGNETRAAIIPITSSPASLYIISGQSLSTCYKVDTRLYPAVVDCCNHTRHGCRSGSRNAALKAT